jgi:hypothetical protein
VGFVVDKVVLGQVFSEYFGFPSQSSFHQILHHHNHPGQATCRVDPVGLHTTLSEFKKKKILSKVLWIECWVNIAEIFLSDAKIIDNT